MMQTWQLLFLAAVIGGVAIAGLVFGLGTQTEPAGWQTAFGTSSLACISPKALFLFRVLLAAVLVSVLLRDLYVCSGGVNFAWWPVFLTNLTLLMETAYSVLLVGLTDLFSLSAGFEQLPNDVGGSAKQPRSFSLLLALFTIQLPLSILTTLLFWTLIFPVPSLCLVRGGEEPCNDLPEFLVLFKHGIATALLLADFAIGSVPFYLRSAGWFLLAGIAYAIWTYVHFQAGIGIGGPCGRDVPLSDCPIYSTIDWREPEGTARLLALLVLVLGPLLALLVRLLGIGRDALGSLCRRRVAKGEGRLPLRG